MLKIKKILLPFILMLFGANVEAAGYNCWDVAAEKYEVDKDLLYSIAYTESRFNPKALNVSNKNGSHDIGIMQINTFWLPTLAKYQITRERLFDPCVNIMVGAWILRQNFNTHGYHWRAIGSYNSPNPRIAYQYAKKVYANYDKIKASNK